MATLLAHTRINPGPEARFEELQSWLYENTHANEPACRRYEVAGVVKELELEWVDPVQGASNLAKTNPQEAPPGARDPAKAYAETYAIKRQPCWGKLQKQQVTQP